MKKFPVPWLCLARKILQAPPQTKELTESPNYHSWEEPRNEEIELSSELLFNTTRPTSI
ncbi:MAG: hypothetical protein LDL41_14360 [Coleofasciculus sp. S288]|nr:hypothetical protein [Coleofasciculus sp. S288]